MVTNLNQYIELAMRTNAPGDKAIERLSQSDAKKILKVLKEISKQSEKLDVLKKSIFYGKNFKPHKPSFLKRLFGIKEKTLQIDETLIHVFHGIVGNQTESGELIDALLKTLEHNQPLDIINIGEELADSNWYHALIYKVLNLSPYDMLTRNINKLSKRYPEKFSEKDAVERNLEAERKVLEGN